MALVGLRPFGQTSTQFADGVAAEQTIRILEIVKALVGRLVAGIGDEAVGIEQAGRTDELVRVPPERRAGRRTAGAQDALVETVQFLAVFRRCRRSRSGGGVSLIRYGLISGTA